MCPSNNLHKRHHSTMINTTPTPSIFSFGMISLLLAQFFSALADNAILVIAIALIKSTAGAPYLVALLQASFLAPFIVFAPFAGAIADGFPKARVMLFANLLKILGALSMASGINPFFSYHLIGMGATLYSPAKYGILSQLFPSSQLVRANGLLESSTIAAILLGVLLGGWLADHSLYLAFVGVIVTYSLAALANLFIPRLAAEASITHYHPWHFVIQFIQATKALFADQDARFSLLGTGIFWGSGTTLRLLLFSWVPIALAINDNQTPANLMAAVSIGIVLGAIAAGLWISMKTVNRALIGGLLIGPMIIALAPITNLTQAAVLMIALGFCSGLFVVPLNALLQERGHQSIGAGNALAVQNLVENLMMMLFAGVYALANFSGVSMISIIIGFGLLLLLTMIRLLLMRRR